MPFFIRIKHGPPRKGHDERIFNRVERRTVHTSCHRLHRQRHVRSRLQSGASSAIWTWECPTLKARGRKKSREGRKEGGREIKPLTPYILVRVFSYGFFSFQSHSLSPSSLPFPFHPPNIPTMSWEGRSRILPEGAKERRREQEREGVREGGRRG